VNEKQARVIVYERSNRLCERCGQKRADTVHHRKNRSQGGTWDPSNLMHLCGDGTHGCHGVLTNTRMAFYGAGWCVKRDNVPAEMGVVYRGRWVFLGDDGSVIEAADLGGDAA
jgi:HNH endonuclease